MLAALHTLTDPWADAFGGARSSRSRCWPDGRRAGCWILFYGLSYSAESLAHGCCRGSSWPLSRESPCCAAGPRAAVAAIAIAAVGYVPAIGRDTSVAVVVTSLFGAGALLALSPASPPGLQGLLFGDVLGVSDADLGLAAGFAVLVLAALAVLHGRLLAVGFDRLALRAWRAPLPVDSRSSRSWPRPPRGGAGLGILLVVAVFVAPASAARLVARRMGR